MSASTTTTRRNVGESQRGRTAAQPSRAASDFDVSNGYFLLIGLIVVLCSFGVMMVLSASSVEALHRFGSSWVFFRKQLMWLAVGSLVMWATSRIDYRLWRRWAVPLLLISAALLVLVLVPGIGKVVGGSRRWIGAGALTMQPSEIAKLAVLLFSADLLSRRAKSMSDWRVATRPIVTIFLVLGALVMSEPDMGTTLVIGSIIVTALFVSGTPLSRMAKLGGAAVAGAVMLAMLEPYRRERLLSFMHPFDDASNTGYQMAQSLIGIGSGGITGVGLGASRAKWGFLPNAHTDFIFAIIAEELGLIGALLVVLLFIGFAFLGVRVASRAPDRFGVLAASCITSWVVFQAFLNIGAVIGLLPVTGVPLPFLSQGGTSLVIIMAATGMLLNISRQGEAVNGTSRSAPRKRSPA